MNKWKVTTIIVSLIFAITLGVGITLWAHSPACNHMVTARDMVRAAHDEFKLAGNVNYGGHRAEADRLLGAVIDEINLGIQYADAHGE